jgi:hypothetical protein
MKAGDLSVALTREQLRNSHRIFGPQKLHGDEMVILQLRQFAENIFVGDFFRAWRGFWVAEL